FKNNMIQILLSSKIPALKTRIYNEKKYREQKSLKNTLLQPYENFIDRLLQIDTDPPLTSNQIKKLKIAGKVIWFENKNQVFDEVTEIEELHDLTNSDLNYLLNLNISTVKPLLSLINNVDRLKNEHDEIIIQLKNAPESSDTSDEERQIE